MQRLRSLWRLLRLRRTLQWLRQMQRTKHLLPLSPPLQPPLPHPLSITLVSPTNSPEPAAMISTLMHSWTSETTRSRLPRARIAPLLRARHQLWQNPLLQLFLPLWRSPWSPNLQLSLPLPLLLSLLQLLLLPSRQARRRNRS